MIRIVCILLACLACIGCANTSYKMPIGAETAQFVMTVNIQRFGSGSLGFTTVKALSKKCKKNDDGEDLGRFTQFVDYEPHKPQEVVIRAGSEFVYEFSYVNPATQYLEGATCWVRSAFIPEAGKKYFAEFTFDQNSCQATLSEMTQSGSKIFVNTLKADCR